MRLLYKRLHLYKTALLLVAVFNIFCVLLGLVMTGSYFLSKKELTTEHGQQMHQLRQVQKAKQLIGEWVILSLEKKQDFSGKQAKFIQFNLWRTWEELREATGKLKTNSPPLFQLPVEKFRAIDTTFYLKASKELDTLEASALNSITSIHHRLSKTYVEFMIIGIGTLIFGVILPLTIMWFIGIALRAAKKEMESRVSDWLANWNQTQKEHQSEPFKNPDFWLKVVLFTVETWAPMSKHPVLEYSSELSFLIRKELEKKENRAA